MTHGTWHMSHATCHMSHVICYLSHVTCQPLVTVKVPSGRPHVGDRALLTETVLSSPLSREVSFSPSQTPGQTWSGLQLATLSRAGVRAPAIAGVLPWGGPWSCPGCGPARVTSVALLVLLLWPCLGYFYGPGLISSVALLVLTLWPCLCYFCGPGGVTSVALLLSCSTQLWRTYR